MFRLKSDEELFSQIPQRDGTVLTGNRPKRPEDPEDATLLGAYTEGLIYAKDTMREETFEVKLTYKSWNDYVMADPYDFSHEKDWYIDKFRTHAYKRIDAYMESHLNQTDGLIGAFPPISHVVGKVGDKEVKYSHVNVKKYCYVPPQYVYDLSNTYNKLHPDERTNIKKYRSYTVAAAFMMIAYFLILAFVPPLLKNMSVVTWGITALVMALAGTLIPYKGLQDGKEMLKFPNGAILCFVLTVINAIGLMNMFGEDWTENILKYVTWAIGLYAIILLLVFVIQLICKETALKKFNKNQKAQLEKTFTELMDRYGEKLHRYIRLRVLWCRYENVSCPQWVSDLEERLELYVSEYNEIHP